MISMIPKGICNAETNNIAPAFSVVNVLFISWVWRVMTIAYNKYRNENKMAKALRKKEMNRDAGASVNNEMIASICINLFLPEPSVHLSLLPQKRAEVYRQIQYFAQILEFLPGHHQNQITNQKNHQFVYLFHLREL